LGQFAKYLEFSVDSRMPWAGREAVMTRHLPENARREQILLAARSCFIENGYHPTRMEEIAKRAGLSKGGVYFHFKSKQDVFGSLVEEEFERSMSMLRSVRQSETPTLEKMQTLAGHYLEYFQSAPEAPRFFVVMGEMSLREEKVREQLIAMQRAYIEEIAALIQQGIDEGILRPIDAQVAAVILKAVIDGLEGFQALSGSLDVTRILGVGIELVMGGMVSRG
jgi:AcrR family transcriptional regulator